MNKIALAIVLAFSLAAQSAALAAPLDSDFVLPSLVHSNAKIRAYDTDFDNDRRGFESLPGTFDPSPLDHLAEYRHSGAHHLDFFHSNRPLFELYRVLRI